MIKWLSMLCAAGLLSLSSAAMAPGDLDARWQLDALHPSDPESYFLLAEEVADASSSEVERRLAIRLFAIAATLDHRQWGVGSLRGILGLVDDESKARAIRSMIELAVEDPPQLLPESMIVLGQNDRATIAAFDVLSWSRCGRDVDARRRIQSVPGVRERLLVYQEDVPGGMQRLIDDLSSRDPSERRRLTEAEHVAQLQVQLRLLGGREDSWSATLMAWKGRPMERLASHDLGTLLGLDLSRQVWRNNRWRPLDEDGGAPVDAGEPQ